MNLSKLAAGYRRWLFPVITLLIGVILLFVGILVTGNQNKGFKETEAEIVGLVEEEPQKTFVKYEVEGTMYDNIEMSQYDSSFSIGKKITILYNPANPTDITLKQSKMLLVFLFVGSAAMIALTVVLVVVNIRSIKKTKALKKEPVINAENRQMGEMKKLYFLTDMKEHIKLRFYIEDENKNILYEGKMIKHNLVGAHTYLFTDYLNHTEVEHKVGHVNDSETGSVVVSRGFTFDGVEITNYFDANKITLSSGIGKHGATTSIYYDGKLIAEAVTSSQYVHEEDAAEHKIASHMRLNQYFYQIEGQMAFIDIIFLALFKEALSPRLGSLL